MRQPLSFRHVHLDFHTSPAIAGVGAQFEAKEFAARMHQAFVTSVNVFAKCHHGHLYYDTKRPERHPGLKPGLDLLGGQIRALHEAGIAAPIYISVQCDEYAANTHPEWCARADDGSVVGRWGKLGVFKPAWQILDMAGPYQEYLVEQVREILDRFTPVDGLWFDMCWDQISWSPWALAGMEKEGLDPEREEDHFVFARNVARAYMRRLTAMVRERNPEAWLYFNCRPVPDVSGELENFAQYEIESLPSGGWGYDHFARVVRFIRTLEIPYLGMTGKFHGSWGDFGGLKPYPALEYETAQMVAHGARSCVGDQLHPRGRLEGPTYDLIGRAYRRIAEREPWLEGARPLAEAAIVMALDPQSRWKQKKDSPQAAANDGAVRMTRHLRIQAELIQAGQDFHPYALLILPDFVSTDPALKERLSAYLAQGGRILATGWSGLSGDGREVLLPALGIQAHGESPYTQTYFRPKGGLTSALPDTDNVMYERGVRVTAQPGATVLASVVEPYFERSWKHFCSHRQTPPDRESPYAAAVLSGPAAYIPFPIFSAYHTHGAPVFRHLVAACLERVLPDPLARCGGPSNLEVVVNRQAERLVVHLLWYPQERRGKDLDLIEDIVPLRDLTLDLACPFPPGAVYLAPSRQTLDFQYTRQRLMVKIPVMAGHEMVAVEPDA